MTAYFALLIPLSFALFLFFAVKKDFNWKFLVIPTTISLFLILSIKYSVEYSLTRDTEYWTGHLVKAEHYDDWTETIVETTTDSKGRTTTTTRYVYHPDEYYTYDNNGNRVSIYSSEYKMLDGKAVSRSKGYWNSTIHIAHLSEDPKNFEICTTSHSYKNKVIASHSVFRHREISAEDKVHFGLYDYPKYDNSWYQNPLIGISDPVSERKLGVLNSKFGHDKQIKVWMLIFQDQPMDAAIAQADYWQGGNKNELVLCVGIDKDQQVQWGYVFSWCENEVFKSTVCTFITNQIGQKMNLGRIIDELEKEIPEGWQRKHFKDFNYLTIDFPNWAIIVIYVVTFLVTGISFFVIYHSEEYGMPSYRHRSRFSSCRS